MSFMPKTGMQMLLENLLPAELLQQIQQAATAIPAIAQKLQSQLDRMETTLAHIESVVERIENKVLSNDPPERTPLSDFVMESIAGAMPGVEHREAVRFLMPTKSNGEIKTVLHSEGTGEFPESLRKELEKDGGN